MHPHPAPATAHNAPPPRPDPAPALALLALAGAVLAALLSGCAQPTLKPVCPPLVAYTRQEQEALAGELQAHPDLPETALFLADYANERNELRAACGR